MPSVYFKTALAAVKQAEKIIVRYYQTQKISYMRKTDKSIVTAADAAAEQVIVSTIKKQFPSHGFWGEESGKDHTQSEFVWIIDPIDGTNNYSRHIPLFGTQLALVHRGEVVLGLSNAPKLGEMMHAEKGKGAYCNGKKVRVSAVDKIEDAYVSFGGLKHFERKGLASSLVQITTDALGARGFGDFWSYHLLAQGKMDLVVEAKVNFYDIAAVKIIVEEAGGVVSDLQGKPVGFDTDTVIASNRALHTQTIKYFRV